MSAGPRPASAAIQRGPGSRCGGGIGVRLEAEEERADLDLALDVVRLGEGVVVERQRRVAGGDLADVVAEGRGRVAVLDEVAARAGEGVAAGEARDLGDAIHAVAALGGEGERHLARAELGLDDLDARASGGCRRASPAGCRARGRRPAGRWTGRSTSPLAPSATPLASRPSPGVRSRVWWTATRSSIGSGVGGRARSAASEAALTCTSRRGPRPRGPA